MIVEFIGASGAGKSTLAHALAAQPAEGGEMAMQWDLVLDRPGLRRILHPTARNVIAEVATLPALIRTWSRNQEFMGFAWRLLAERSRSRFEQLNYQRSIMRKVGMYELARDHGGGNSVVLADEGTLLIAYYLFVYSRSPFQQAELNRFASLVPLPERIVYVRAPLESLIDRAVTRVDRRRELASLERSEIAHWIARAVEMFDYLANTPPIRDRILTIDNVDDSGANRKRLLDLIGEFVHAGRSGQSQHPSEPPLRFGS
jgi:thymidylate kinase